MTNCKIKTTANIEDEELDRTKKWIALEDFETLRDLAYEMFEQLELMDYEKKDKETYDEFKDELSKTQHQK